MKTRRRLAALVLFLAACGGDTTGPVVTSVTVTAPATRIKVGQTLQFIAAATDAAGAAVTGQTVTWTSSDLAVATIDTTGLATGVSEGVVSILATVAGVPGSTALTIDPNTCEGAVTVDLQAGEHEKFAPNACLILPSGNAGDRYRVALLRTHQTGTASDVITGTLEVTGLGVTQAAAATPRRPIGPAAAPEADRLPGLDPEQERRLLRRIDVTARAHAALRAEEERLARQLGWSGILPSRPLLAAGNRAPSPDTMVFNVGSGCSSTTTATAALIHENDDMAIYQDVEQRATKEVTLGTAREMTTWYSANSKEVIDSYFGAVPDIDENGRVVVFITPVAAGDTSAFVSSRDFRTQDECAASNEMELVYFNADLVDGTITTPDDTIDLYWGLETLPHEAAHVSSLFHRIWATDRTGTSQFHPVWLEEGRAELAAEMTSRLAWSEEGGPAANERVTQAQIRDAGIARRTFGVVLMIQRTIWYTASLPNGLMVEPDGADVGASIYSSGWHFNRFLGDAYGGAADAPFADSTFFRALSDSTAGGGFTGLEVQTGSGYQQLLEEFVVSIMTHESTTNAPERSFSTYDFVDLTDNLWNNQPDGTYPFPATGPDPVGYGSANYANPMGPGGFAIHDFISPGIGTGAQLQAEIADPAAIIVVRLR